MTFNNLFFEKIIVSQTKLRYTRQKIINDYNDFKNVKNIRRKIVKTYYIYEVQKFVVFYQYEKIQQISNKMIKNVCGFITTCWVQGLNTVITDQGVLWWTIFWWC